MSLKTNKALGRPKSENPKNIRLEIRLTQEQSQKLEECSKEMSVTKTDVIIKGIDLVSAELKK